MPKLLDCVRRLSRLRRHSRRTEQSYVFWIKRFIHFHRLRYPAEMGPEEVTAFLSHLASERGVSASTQNQALSALLAVDDLNRYRLYCKSILKTLCYATCILSVHYAQWGFQISSYLKSGKGIYVSLKSRYRVTFLALV